MSETKVICNSCGESVLKKRFCGECGAPLTGANNPKKSTSNLGSTKVTDDLISSDSGVKGAIDGQSLDTIKSAPSTTPNVINQIDRGNSNLQSLISSDSFEQITAVPGNGSAASAESELTKGYRKVQ